MDLERFQFSLDDAMSGAALPPEMLAGLYELSQLDTPVVEAISGAIDSLQGLNQSDDFESVIASQLPDDCQSYATSLLRIVRLVDLEEVPKIVSTVSSWVARKEDRADLFTDIATLETNLRTLVASHPPIELLKKADRLIRDTGDELQSVKFICDLRPVFSTDRERVEAMVLLANMRIRYVNQAGIKEVCELALTGEELQDLKESIDKAVDKLAILERVASSLSDTDESGDS